MIKMLNKFTEVIQPYCIGALLLVLIFWGVQVTLTNIHNINDHQIRVNQLILFESSANHFENVISKLALENEHTIDTKLVAEASSLMLALHQQLRVLSVYDDYSECISRYEEVLATTSTQIRNMVSPGDMMEIWPNVGLLIGYRHDISHSIRTGDLDGC